MACPDCFSGTIHTETPTGATTTIHGIATYVTEPENGIKPKGIVVVICDAFGWELANSRLLADKYAKKGGYLVYVPDFMNGNAMDPIAMKHFERIQAPASWLTTLFIKPFWILNSLIIAIPWLIKTRPAVCKPRVFKFFQQLRTSSPPFETNNLKIGVAGFCWGGKYSFLLAADSPSSRVQRHESQINSWKGVEQLIDCAFTAHPSMLTLPMDAEAVQVPVSVCVGDEDSMLKLENVELVKEILEVKKKGDHEVVVIKGAKHGFGVRVDWKDAFMAECAEKAEKQALGWFGKWLS